jgi:hypothetical protein
MLILERKILVTKYLICILALCCPQGSSQPALWLSYSVLQPKLKMELVLWKHRYIYHNSNTCLLPLTRIRSLQNASQHLKWRKKGEWMEGFHPGMPTRCERSWKAGKCAGNTQPYRAVPGDWAPTEVKLRSFWKKRSLEGSLRENLPDSLGELATAAGHSRQCGKGQKGWNGSQVGWDWGGEFGKWGYGKQEEVVNADPKPDQGFFF